MKLASYEYENKASFGVVSQRGICDMPSHWPAGPRSVLEALQSPPATLERMAKLAARSDLFLSPGHVKLLAPIPSPPKLMGLAVNYVEHHHEIDRGQILPNDARNNTTPRPFLMPSTAVAASGDVIPWPSFSRQIDHEVELAVVIGSVAKCVSPEQARQHIVGYTIANDISARSVTHAQGRTPRPKDDFFDWLHGKWADAFCPLGPYLVTADEVGDPSNLSLELTVNGQVRQKASTAQMIFNVFELVSFCSHLMTLVPGDIIATGTPSGVGLATGNFLRAGDVITCRIEKLGELTNTLGAEPTEYYAPCRK